jgi:nickel transport protein
MKFFVFYAAVILTTLFPSVVFGHGVEVYEISNEISNKVKTVYFKYSTGEPMMYAKIRVYPPSQPDMENLQSITDPNGYFSFVPDETGEWRITAEDGMGHKGTITVLAENSASGELFSGTNAASSVSGTDTGGKKTPLPFRITLGLSLILNVFAVYNFALKKRTVKKDASHAH